MDWEGQASWANSLLQHVGVEVFNVGGWLTRGDLALEVDVDFLAVVEHRLIPARVRSEWARLKKKGLASIWAPASQESSHVGHGGVGVISMKSAPLALPTFATAQFRSFFNCGRAVRYMLPLGFGRFMHLVVLYGSQGADKNTEQRTLTEQLFDAALSELSAGARDIKVSKVLILMLSNSLTEQFDAALGELGCVAREQPSLMVGDFTVDPTKIPCLAKGISAGLCVDFEDTWALAAGLQPAPICKRNWDSAGGHRWILWLVALLLLLQCSACQVDRSPSCCWDFL